jgi:hypothetical protein
MRYANGCITIVRTARAAENGQQTFGSSRKNKMAIVGNLRNGCAKIGIPQPSLRGMPRDFCLICHSRGSRSRVIAKFAESGELVFTSMYALLYGWAIFIGKKGS